MTARARFAFLLLVLAQAAHSVEEYLFRLWEVFAPARTLSGLVSEDLPVGFVVLNGAFVLFGLWCYLARVRPGHPSARAWVWPWVVVEVANGVVHPTMAFVRGGYFPGVATAVILLGLAVYLGREMTR